MSTNPSKPPSPPAVQGAVLPALPLALYRLHLTALGAGPVGDDPYGLWHGVLGRSLHELHCIQPGLACDHCLLLHQCRYPRLFLGLRPPDAEIMRRYDRVPVPHVLHIPPEHPRLLRRGEELVIGVVLAGDANADWNRVIGALSRASGRGLGPERVPLRLEEAIQYVPGAPEPIPVAAQGRLFVAAPPACPPLPPAPGALRLRFLSPYKAPSQARGKLDLERLLMALVRRVSLMQYFYTGRRLDADYKALKQAAGQVLILDDRLRRQPRSQYGIHRGKRLGSLGLIGELDLDLTGAGAALWPYLHAGAWVNVGKNASMGFGSFQVIALA